MSELARDGCDDRTQTPLEDWLPYRVLGSAEAHIPAGTDWFEKHSAAGARHPGPRPDLLAPGRPGRSRAPR